MARRVALVVLGIVLGVTVLEGALQVAALALRATQERTPGVWLTGRRRVLCVGDSNTYGLYLRDRALAYPQQLERLWNASGATPPIEVLNLGYPGTNTSRLRRDLPRMLDTLRPDVLLVMVGANDYWTAAVPVESAENLRGRLLEWLEYSRIYHLTHMLIRAHDPRRLEIEYPVKDDGGRAGTARFGEVEFPMGFDKAPRRPTHDQDLVANLRAIADIARRFGAEPVFLTYPSRMWNYGDASRLTRPTAEAAGARLVDLAVVFEPVCPTEPCPKWLYKDHHPTADGYRLVAETLVRELQR